MRTIKFRGKDVTTGEWRFGDLIHGVGNKHGRMYILPITHIYPKGCNELDGWEVIPETVGQLIGLTDKNGKEIYEGDITNAGIKGSLARIIYLDGAFQYEYLTKPQKPDVYRFEYHKMNTHEVIGNIHDNPELLK